MGLDVTAYRSLKAVRPLTSKEIDDCETEDGLTMLCHTNDDFPDHAEGIDPTMAYAAADTFAFRAGSYSGYNEWRDQLARIAGHRSASDAWERGTGGKPFGELINFSDCEGIVGSKVAARLAKDFADNQNLADAFDGADSEWFKARYADWRKAFEMAAHDGAVQLH